MAKRKQLGEASALRATILRGYDSALSGDFQDSDIQGDGLLVFLLRELSAGEDCDSRAEAMRRLNTIADQIEGVRSAFEADEAAAEAAEEAAYACFANIDDDEASA